MRKLILVNATAVALCTFVSEPAFGQVAAGTTRGNAADETTPGVENVSASSEIIVTGAPRAQRRFDAGFCTHRKCAIRAGLPTPPRS